MSNEQYDPHNLEDENKFQVVEDGKKLRKEGWIGVDLDRTLAEYHHWTNAWTIGAPIGPMLRRVKRWLEEGYEVRVFTARVSHDNSESRMLDAQRAQEAIREWCVKHLGRELPVTCVKDFGMWMLWDDRAVGVLPNLGERTDAYLGDYLPGQTSP